MHNVNAIVEKNLKLVPFLVNKYFGGGINYNAQSVTKEDLIQIGYIGLIKAAKGFDESRNVKFSTYASRTIIFEITRDFRDKGSMIKFSRPIKENAVKAYKALGKDATINEVAEFLNLNDKDAVDVYICIQNNSIKSLDSTISYGNNADESNTLLIDALIDENSLSLEDIVISNVTLEEKLSALEEREKIVLYKHYDGYTQSDIGKYIGVSQVQVSRILKKAMKKLELVS